MAAKPIPMEQLKQVLLLHQEGQSIKAIVRLTGLSRNTVRTYLHRHEAASGDSIPQTDTQLAASLYNQDTTVYKGQRYQQLQAHLQGIEKELSRPGVTRQLLWREYLQQHPDGYGYSQYCYHLHQLLRNKDVTMHLEYQPAELLMVDFAGKRPHYVDKATGERITCEVFVATLPYSGLIFCIAVHSQRIPDFLHACNELLKYIGGATQTILCDNLRTAVSRSDKYEPVFTDLCYQLSDHYDTTFSATRPGKPRDKAMVEKAVNIIYRKVYAPLRHQTFFSISELNEQYRKQLDLLNRQTYKGSAFSRMDLFQQEEQGLLRILPAAVFTLKKGVLLTVQRNYHIQLREEGLYYSVPWQYVGKKVKVWYDQRTVEVYYDHQRIALHTRSNHGRGYTTLHEHMPPNHKVAATLKGWNRDTLLQQAGRIGTDTQQVAEKILGNSIYLEQNYKACFGMLMLAKRYGPARLEAACSLALTGMRINYTMIRNILQAGTDKQIRVAISTPLPQHDNIRGPQQYQ